MDAAKLIPIAAAAAAGAVGVPLIAKIDEVTGSKPYLAPGLGLVAGGAIAFMAEDQTWLSAIGLGLAAVSGFAIYSETQRAAAPAQHAAGMGLSSIVGAPAAIRGASHAYAPGALVFGSKDMIHRDPRIAAIRTPAWAR